MLKRNCLIVLVIAGLGAFVWLSHGHKIVRSDSVENGRTIHDTRMARDGNDMKPDGNRVPESPRNAADEEEIHQLNQAIRDQESKVEERRKVLATIVRTKGIIYRGQDSFYGTSSVDEGRKALDKYDQLLRERNQLEGQINSLLKYDGDQLLLYAARLDLPENVIRNIYPLYLESKRHLEDLKIKGLGKDHPTVKAAASQIAAIKRQLDEGVVTLRGILQAKWDLADESLKKMVEGAKGDTRDNAIKKGPVSQDYIDAKKDFETDQQLLQEMKLKQHR